MVPDWVAQYVGLEFQSHGRGPRYDCWGLVKLVLWEQFRIITPDFSDHYNNTQDVVGIPKAFEIGINGPWTEVQDGALGDVVIFNIAGRAMHCGLVVAPGCMLHIRPVTGSCLEQYNKPQWARRIDGFYRHDPR